MRGMYADQPLSIGIRLLIPLQQAEIFGDPSLESKTPHSVKTLKQAHRVVQAQQVHQAQQVC